MGTGDTLPGVKAAGARISPLSSIQYRDQELWSYNSTPLQVLMAWCLRIKNRDNFTVKFTFYILFNLLFPIMQQLTAYVV
jgi:hypothetical protein